MLLHSQQRHPNIVQLIGVYYPPHSQLPMLVMEYLPLSLTQCLEREELPLQMKYSILVDVAKGLCYLHGKRPPIVHRDLTANNVLLTSSYSAKISDLGVSRLTDMFKKHHLTRAPGNPVVMPPEALRDNPVYDHKLDVFSYGCLILHVLTGQFPQPTNQFVPEPGQKPEPGKRASCTYIKVSEWDRRSSCIENIPKENELLPLAKQCLNDESTDRPEITNALLTIQQVLLKYPKMKNTMELIKENKAVEKHAHKLDTEIKVLKAEKTEKDKLEKQLMVHNERLIADNERLTADYEQQKADHEQLIPNYEDLSVEMSVMSSQVIGLQNALSSKEKEFNDCTEVLKETIRSRDEQLVKQREENMVLLKKRESYLKDKHLKELSEMKKRSELMLSQIKEDYEEKLSTIREDNEAKLLTTSKKEQSQIENITG